MAAISTYLAKIKSAVYGEEVRGSIHDAIQAINTENQSVLNTANTYKTNAETANTNAQAAKAAAVAAQTAAETANKNAQAAMAAAAQSAADAAADLASIDEVEDMRDTMLSSGLVTDVLLDSSGNAILDSTGHEILSQKVFVEASVVAALSQKLTAIETLLMALLRKRLPDRVSDLESDAKYLINHALIDSIEEE